MAALMRRAVQQAKAESAAQLSATETPTDKPQTQRPGLKGSQGLEKAAANGKRTLAVMLQKAAQKMQEEDAVAASQTTLALQTAAEASLDGAADISQSAEDTHASSSDSALDSDQVQLSSLALTSSSPSNLELTSSPDAAPLPGRQLSLGDRLVSMLKSAQNAMSPSRQASYVPMDADSPPEASPEASQEADMADVAAGEKQIGRSRGALPREGSLGQRLGSVFSGSLLLPRQTSYMPVEEEADAGGDESSRQQPLQVLPTDVSLRERYGFASSFRHMPESEAKKGAQQIMHDELSVSGEPSHKMSTLDLTLGVRSSGLGSDPTDESAPLSPSRRRALPRDASYLPEWVHGTLGRSSMAKGNGHSRPRLQLGNSFSSVGAASDEADTIPQWVDWPSSDQEIEPAEGQLLRVEEEDLDPPVPLLMAPPRVRGANHGSLKEPLAQPSLEPPLTFPQNLLVPTPLTNPSVALRTPQIPIATPKGQRLFDFWHEKADSVPSPVGQPSPSQAATLESHSSTDPLALHSERLAASQASANQAAAERLSPSEAAAHHAPFSTASSRQTAASQVPYSPTSAAQVSASQSPSATAAGLPSAPTFSKAEAAQAALQNQPQLTGRLTPHALHASTAQADLVAELEATSQLVQQQSLRQAELLEGLEQALLQLSEHRLLIQNPVAAPQDSLSEENGAGHGELALAAGKPHKLLKHSRLRCAHLVYCLCSSLSSDCDVTVWPVFCITL